MSNYLKYKIYLTPNQKHKIQTAFKTNTDCILRIQPKNGNTNVMLSVTQINNILKAKRENKNVDLHLSKTQLHKSGGFLPLLAAALPFLTKAAATGAIGYAGSKIAQKVIGKGNNIKKTKSRGSGTTQLSKNIGKGIKLPGKKIGKGIFVPGKIKKSY